jgi:hypothetical protein
MELSPGWLLTFGNANLLACIKSNELLACANTRPLAVMQPPSSEDIRNT